MSRQTEEDWRRLLDNRIVLVNLETETRLFNVAPQLAPVGSMTQGMVGVSYLPGYQERRYVSSEHVESCLKCVLSRNKCMKSSSCTKFRYRRNPPKITHFEYISVEAAKKNCGYDEDDRTGYKHMRNKTGLGVKFNKKLLIVLRGFDVTDEQELNILQQNKTEARVSSLINAMKRAEPAIKRWILYKIAKDKMIRPGNYEWQDNVNKLLLSESTGLTEDRASLWRRYRDQLQLPEGMTIIPWILVHKSHISSLTGISDVMVLGEIDVALDESTVKLQAVRLVPWGIDSIKRTICLEADYYLIG